MLKKIPTAQAELGMFLQSMEGSWLAHPFWKTKFLLTDAADLAALKASGVPHIWIDVVKGRDVEAPAAGVPCSAPPTPPVPIVAEPAAPPTPPRALAMHEELEQAAKVVQRSKEAVIGLFKEARLGRTVDREQSLAVVNELSESVWRHPSALISLARLKTKDDYTYLHSVAVSAMMISLAQQLGLDKDAQREAGLAGLLHDVGKMQVPLALLNKPGALTDDEFRLIKTHPERGYEALRQSEAFSPAVLDVVLHHHEKVDGSGYPHKLAGEGISLIARMGAVCDVYDAISSDRPYKKAWDPGASIARMAGWQGHFDPTVFKAFVSSLGIYPVGTLVKLKSQRLAVVVDQNPGQLTRPQVRVFYSLRSKLPISVSLLNLLDGSDAIVGREDPATWGFTHLTELWNPK